jgi:hypothetical protein
MELSPSEATSYLATQEILSISWNSKASLLCSEEPSTGPYPEAIYEKSKSFHE